MKTLHLLRHAKSAWDDPGLPDRQRPLNKRGRRDAPRMGAALAAEMAPVDSFVSPARRACLTLAGLCEGWPALADCDHTVDEALYTFSAAALWRWLAATDSDRSSLFIIGHNPALTELINELLGQWQLDNLPTAGYARLSLSIECWSQLQAGCGQLQRLLIPRELPG
ncbi:phosphoglycerate mutase [Seongchinamella unica]|uniref:Phosphoglycerate mutase n=1 Tax=Seongchinamella unica TaxID=2547392 RepID=A0A4R5LQV3_9GAMM|nr:histidine phosphatase family protein [Seongchinamella unica]TDG12958.1 phosphoglycerate mutase [Seongchinamella unica]